LFICRELDGTIRYDSNAIYPIPSHESPETFLFPHPNETAPYSGVRLARIPRLNLSTNAANQTPNVDATIVGGRRAHWIILSRSSGETIVRDAAPAIPPAMKYDDTCGLNHGSGFGSGVDAGTDVEPATVAARWTVDCSEVMTVGVEKDVTWTCFGLI